MLQTNECAYNADTALIGHYAYDDSVKGKRPGILICHDWSGRNDFAQQKAAELAQLGYLGFALDLYGQGKTAETKEEKTALMQPLMQNRQTLLLGRLRAAFQAMTALPECDATKTAIIGFCFGGLCALDFARSGAAIKGAVSFHGLLFAPDTANANDIKAKILVLHGYDDPMVKKDVLIQFADEMTKAGANWEIDIYGKTVHGFTNPKANDPAFGTVYNPEVTARAMRAMKGFFEEIF